MSGSELVSAKEIAEVLGKTIRFVNMMATERGWAAEIVNKRGDRKFFLSQLPAEIQERIMRHRCGIDEDSVEEAAAYFEVKIPPEKLKDPAVATKVRMLCDCLAVPHWVGGRKARIRYIAEEYGYNVATAYRLMDRVKKGAEIISSTRNFGVKIESLGITVRAWDHDAAHIAIEEIIANRRKHQEKISIYKRIQRTAREKGLKVGCYESFCNLHRRVADSLITFRDKGARGLREDVVPAIRRDHTAYRAMECLVGDQHKADYDCFDYKGDVATLELFCWMDFRTQMTWGAIAYRHYNRYTVGQALINAVRWGMPGELYTDWGKPEESHYTASLIEQLTGLGIKTGTIQHTRAKVRHPQAKPIEGWFGRFDKVLRNERIPGYCKRLKDARESELQQKELTEMIRAGELLGIEEMVDRVFGMIEKQNDHVFKNRGEDTGKTPRQLYNESVSRYPVTTLSEDVLEYIFLPVQAVTGNGKPLTVRRSQVKIRHEFFKRTLTYYGPELADYGGTEVFVRYHPFDPGRVWIFSRASGSLLCRAEEWGMINPKNRDQVAAKIEMQNRLVKQISQKYRLWLPEKTPKTHVPRIHPHEREAREVRDRESKIRVLRTQLEGAQLRAVSGPGYRPLTYKPAPPPEKSRPVMRLTINDPVRDEDE